MTENQKKLESLKKAGVVAHNLHLEIGKMANAGVNLLEIEKFALGYIQKVGMSPSFQGFRGYPSATCLSVNDQVVHGIPVDYELQDGDVLSVDLGVTKDGWIVDTARTHIVGSGDEQAKKLIEVTTTALREAIKLCRPNNRIGDLGAKIEQIVEGAGFAIIGELNGHGVGRRLQEPPSIPNFGINNTGPTIKEGMVLAIEPITCLKPTSIDVLDDGWTILASNGLICAHVEDTIIVTNNGPVTLT